MIRKLLLILTLVSLLYALNSCTTGIIMISVLQPAEVSLPGHIRGISIYPVAGIPTPSGIFDSISNISIDQAYNYNITRKGYVYGMYEVLSASPRFQKVMLADSGFVDSLYFGLLSWDILQQICSHDSTDAVLVVKKVVAYDSINYLDESQFVGMGDDLSYAEKYEYSCTLFFRMISHIKLAIYEPAGRRKSAQFSFSDTIDLYSSRSCGDISSPDSMRDLLYNACFYSGMKIGERLAPLWDDEVVRFIYSGWDLGLRDAYVLARNRQWTEGGRIWEVLSRDKHRRTAGKASFNMALAWEQADDLAQALLWLDYADSLCTIRKTAAYRKVLEERLLTKSLLDKQFVDE